MTEAHVAMAGALRGPVISWHETASFLAAECGQQADFVPMQGGI